MHLHSVLLHLIQLSAALLPTTEIKSEVKRKREGERVREYHGGIILLDHAIFIRERRPREQRERKEVGEIQREGESNRVARGTPSLSFSFSLFLSLALSNRYSHRRRIGSGGYSSETSRSTAS